MINLQRLSNQLIRHEGMKTHVYRCSENKHTIAVGRNIDPDGGIGLTERECRFLLENDIARCCGECQQNFTWWPELDEVRKEAVANMVFNLGISRFLQFKKCIAAIEAKDYEMAGAEALNSRWAEQVGNRAVELANQLSSGQVQAY